MAKLIYVTNISLDGFVADEAGNFNWTEPSEEVFTFITDLQRSVGTYLYGRRLYETMVYWETAQLADQPDYIQDFSRIWKAASKIVYSTTLKGISSAQTRLEPNFDPEEVRVLKSVASSDLNVGGPTLAAVALRAGLVDELQIFLLPIIIGSGNYFLPSELRLNLELLDERRFSNGTVFLHYRVKPIYTK